MKPIFTTLFNSYYLAKGIALCRSLEKVCDDYHLYIFAFDADTEKILSAMCSSENVTIISLADLEAYYPALREVKQSRGVGEYCWTCKGPSMQYIFDVYNASNCAYLDSDLYFYQSPECILQGLSDADVVLTPHNFYKDYDLSATNGFYCAQYLWFNNTENARKILNWWTDLCIDWCYGKHEQGKFGDQKYLERFSKEWENVYATSIHGCCAPWNIRKFNLSIKDSTMMLQDTNTNILEPIVCYHFHFLKNANFGLFNEFTFGPYLLDKNVQSNIYYPYIELLIEINNDIQKIKPTLDSLGSSKVKQNRIMQMLHFIKNIFRKNKYIWR